MTDWTASITVYTHEEGRTTASLKVWSERANQDARRPHWSRQLELWELPTRNPELWIQRLLQDLRDTL